MLGHRTRTAALLGVMMLAACTYHPSRFPIYGTTDDRAPLAGEWFGEFTSTGTGRNGNIGFRLEPGRDSASGDVSMETFYVGAQVRYQEHRPHPGAAAAPALRIRHVRAGASILEGVIEPFHDPDCDCMVTTRFRGVVRGDSIAGTYVGRGGATTREGAWHVTRRSAAPVGETVVRRNRS